LARVKQNEEKSKSRSVAYLESSIEFIQAFLGSLPKALANHLRLSNDRFVTNSQMGNIQDLYRVSNYSTVQSLSTKNAAEEEEEAENGPEVDELIG
jgi:hypothetical protein